MKPFFVSIALGFVLFGCASKKAADETSGATAKTYTLPSLPYAYSDLEPVFDAKTMEIHHSKHHKAYVDNLNKALVGEKTAASKSLYEIMAKISKFPASVRNNGGGHYNHTLFWKLLKKPSQVSALSPALEKALVDRFGSLEQFKADFNLAATGRFGSGWAWLIVNAEGALEITTTPNQDNPLMDVAEKRGFPILAVDVWEHAYYLHYQNRRADYLKEWWKLVDWAYVSKRFESSKEDIVL